MKKSIIVLLGLFACTACTERNYYYDDDDKSSTDQENDESSSDESSFSEDSSSSSEESGVDSSSEGSSSSSSSSGSGEDLPPAGTLFGPCDYRADYDICADNGLFCWYEGYCTSACMSVSECFPHEWGTEIECPYVFSRSGACILQCDDNILDVPEQDTCPPGFLCWAGTCYIPD